PRHRAVDGRHHGPHRLRGGGVRRTGIARGLLHRLADHGARADLRGGGGRLVRGSPGPPRHPGHRVHAAGRGAHHPAATSGRAPALPDAHPGAAHQAARSHGNARHMSSGAIGTAARPVAASGPGGLLRRQWPWLAALAVAVVVPWVAFDWSTGRHSGFAVSMLSQIGIMIVFALSYNMLMGQAGLLSFGHAVFLGLGGYVTAHVLNATKGGGVPLPLELTPLAGALGGLGFALVLGYFATQQRA